MFCRLLLGCLHLLIYLVVFHIVKLHFGLIGHTHDGEEQVRWFVVTTEARI